jgi:2-keto-4-pentenoate hydratase
MTSEVRNAARQLIVEHDSGIAFGSSPGILGKMSLETAYQVQDAFVDGLIGRGLGDVAGYKIGFTTVPGQNLVGLSAPVSGVILESRVHQGLWTARAAEFQKLRIECELAVHFKSSVPVVDTAPSVETILKCIDTVHAAFELLDYRKAHLDAHSGPLVIADNAWNAGIVVGPGVRPPEDLRELKGTLIRHREICATGSSNNVLGDPALSLSWLAAHLASRNRQIEAGQWVMTGAVIPPTNVQAGEYYRFELANLPPVELKVI